MEANSYIIHKKGKLALGISRDHNNNIVVSVLSMGDKQVGIDKDGKAIRQPVINTLRRWLAPTSDGRGSEPTAPDKFKQMVNAYVAEARKFLQSELGKYELVDGVMKDFASIPGAEPVGFDGVNHLPSRPDPTPTPSAGRRMV